METIKNYLDNIFSRLPLNNDVIRLKEDLLANMEEKYNELKAQGRSENEAIGIVISEFGNVDELINELDIQKDIKEVENIRTVSSDEVNEFLTVKRRSGILIGLGVFLCILGVALLILISGAFSTVYVGAESVYEVMGLVALFICIAIAVGLFIYSGVTLEKYNYLNQPFTISSSINAYLVQQKDRFDKTFLAAIIIGVMLCILSPLVLIVISFLGNYSDYVSSIGVVVLLIMIAIAVFTFIWAGVIKESYKILLQIEDYSREYKEEDKVVGAVASIVWPITVCAFLIWGFFFHGWGISWILFPIVGILFGCFSAAYHNLKTK